MTTKKTVAWSLFLTVVAFIQLACVFIIACQHSRWVAENWLTVAWPSIGGLTLTNGIVWAVFTYKHKRREIEVKEEDIQRKEREREGTVEVKARYRVLPVGHTPQRTIHKIDIHVVRSGTRPVKVVALCVKRDDSPERYEIKEADIPTLASLNLTKPLMDTEDRHFIILRKHLLTAFAQDFTTADFPFGAQIILTDSLGNEHKSNVFQIPSVKKDS